jgi:predicted HTH domain antitoxin
MHVLSVRLDEDLEKKLEFLTKKLKIIDKSTYIRQLLDKSLSEEMIEVLCKQIVEKQISAWKAAEIAGISLRKMLDELKKRNISEYDEQSLKEDLNFALE